MNLPIKRGQINYLNQIMHDLSLNKALNINIWNSLNFQIKNMESKLKIFNNANDFFITLLR
jgi:hypothetical protein